ncbi:MAG: type secretion system protein VirB3 [Candidatus Midichloriaceae bacterium]|nr:type secretion system protein VirB3 [Candidatus Midichloriaceae bacterium]
MVNSMSSENKVSTDPLFVGLTRPPLLFGVSYTYFVVNALISMVAYIATSQFQFLAMAVPVHLVGFYICSKEPLFIELFKVKAEKCSRCRNKFYHGANSYDPF